MSSTTIGIKIADGSFYPILERDVRTWKRVILTTVKDGQTNVQIDLYEGSDISIESAKYVGSLLIEDIAPAPAGESEIELRIGVDEEGKLSARAEDLSSGESQSLHVSLESLAEDGIYDIPEFELGNELDTWPDSDDAAEEIEDEPLDEIAGSFDERLSYADYEAKGKYDDPGLAHVPPPRRKPFLLALFIILGITAVAALTIFLYKVFEGPGVPLLEAREGPPVAVAADSQPGVESPADAGTDTAAITEAGTEEMTRDGPVLTEADASPPTSDPYVVGVWYWIRRGDTLWDISASFYRTPWRYGRIANENSIRNPDLIFTGTKIFIPKKE